MKQVINVQVGQTITITREANEISIETTPKNLSIFDTVKPGDILKCSSGGFILVKNVVRQTTPWGEDCVMMRYVIISASNEIYEEAFSCEVRKDFRYEGTKHATTEEMKILSDMLRDKHSLMWNGDELISWRANPGEKFVTININGFIEVRTDNRYCSENKLYDYENYFPIGFLNNNHISELNDLTSKLFTSWKK